jgi:uncharacterized surface protein with fasciclin (FAS1) repeats
VKRIALIVVLALAAVPAASAQGRTDAGGGKGKNIVQTAVAAGQFTTLVSLVQQAGLAPALSGRQKLTVFAPTDAAFAKVPQSTLDALAQDREALRRVLLYHVVKGKAPAKRVVKLRSAKTLAGDRVRFTVSGSTVRVNDARITAVDVKASNGVIHVIDTVLLPPR